MRKQVKKQKRIDNIVLVMSTLLAILLNILLDVSIKGKVMILIVHGVTLIAEAILDRCPYCHKFLGARNSRRCPNCGREFRLILILLIVSQDII